jgi:hypothetical protein
MEGPVTGGLRLEDGLLERPRCVGNRDQVAHRTEAPLERGGALPFDFTATLFSGWLPRSFTFEPSFGCFFSKGKFFRIFVRRWKGMDGLGVPTTHRRRSSSGGARIDTEKHVVKENEKKDKTERVFRSTSHGALEELGASENGARPPTMPDAKESRSRSSKVRRSLSRSSDSSNETDLTASAPAGGKRRRKDKERKTPKKSSSAGVVQMNKDSPKTFDPSPSHASVKAMIEAGDLRGLKVYVHGGKDMSPLVDPLNRLGHTALHIAAEHGTPSLVFVYPTVLADWSFPPSR